MRKSIFIKPDDGVVHVGFRPWIMDAALDYNLKAFPRNVPCEPGDGGRRCVGVILDGGAEDVNSFISDLQNKRIHPLGVEDYTLTNSSEPVSEDVDWTYSATALTCGQMGEFVHEARKLTSEVSGMRGEMREGFESLPKRIAEELERVRR